MGLVLSCVAFLVGSFPTGVIVTRVLTGRDVRQYGSGNIGAANVVRAAGFKVGILVLLLDMVKGAVPVLIGRALGLSMLLLALVGLLAVLGHDFSLFLRFRGGKGVATTLGAMLALAPLPTALALLTYLVVMLVWRYSSLASLTALALLPADALLTRQPQVTVWLAAALFAIAALKHWENIVRLANGKEPKFRLPSTDDR